MAETTGELLVDELTRAFREEVQFRGLWQLASPGTAGTLDDLVLEFVEPTEAELHQNPEDPTSKQLYEVLSVRPHRDPRKRGECMAREYTASAPTYDEQEKGDSLLKMTVVRVRNETFETIHLYVLSLTEARGIELLWPDEHVKDRTIDEDGKPIRVRIWIGAEKGWQLDRPMRDRMFVVASKRPIDFATFTGKLWIETRPCLDPWIRSDRVASAIATTVPSLRASSSCPVLYTQPRRLWYHSARPGPDGPGAPERSFRDGQSFSRCAAKRRCSPPGPSRRCRT